MDCSVAHFLILSNTRAAVTGASRLAFSAAIAGTRGWADLQKVRGFNFVCYGVVGCFYSQCCLPGGG